jgi:ribosomal protein S12 methylthiotransferase accessory factor YcaO
LFLKKPSLHLKSRKKCRSIDDGDIVTSRIKPAKETLDKVIPICKKIGVTRIADITYMDKLYIPNYSAILPGTDDKTWIYSGKGPTKIRAKVSALMEAIERYSSLSSTNSSRCFIRGSYNELSKKYRILHPEEVVVPLKFKYKNDMVIDFLIGVDLFTNEQILVPAGLVFYNYHLAGDQFSVAVVNPFTLTHTNGLASGNVIEEAVCHALCEIIERDAASIAELCASAIPYNILQNIVNTLKRNGYSMSESLLPDITAKFIDDFSIFSDVDISELAEKHKLIKLLVKRFHKANIPLLVKEITQEDIGIATFMASSSEWITNNYGYFTYGYGTHPDARIALVRAITELSQSRAANMYVPKQDLRKTKEEDEKNNEDISKKLWRFVPSLPSSSSSSSNSKNIKKFSEIKSYINEDVLDDIKLILDKLKKSGLKKTIVVDLTNPSIGIPVVRAIVPGLETFDITRSIMGRRAKNSFIKKKMNQTNI